jgi:hypothetical protein
MRALALAAVLLCIGPGLFLTSVEAVAAPPPNDNFANATLLTGNSGSVSVSIAEATREPNEPQDQYCLNGTAWYKWVAPAAGELQTKRARGQIFCWQLRRMLVTYLRNFASTCVLEATP